MVEQFSDLHDELLRIAAASGDDPSGAARAREAHRAGAVAPLQPRPLQDVQVHFTLHGSERQAHEICQALVGALWEGGLVSTPVDYSIEARP